MLFPAQRFSSARWSRFARLSPDAPLTPDQCQKRRQHGRRGLMTPIAEQTREPDAEHSAIQPGSFCGRFSHFR